MIKTTYKVSVTHFPDTQTFWKLTVSDIPGAFTFADDENEFEEMVRDLLRLILDCNDEDFELEFILTPNPQA